ncbi:MAG: glycosyltransferase family 4 protein [Spirochaetaceae bacterium]|jgi:glycosyltransferase involved in cell wall biosynthesis|nr:glycosyltransferase family 4 protein [Spirochaetaceae bacterium]
MKNILFVSHSNLMAGAETVMLAGLRAISRSAESGALYVLFPKGKEMLFKQALNGIIPAGNCLSLPYKCLRGSLPHFLIVLLFNACSILRLCLFVKKHRIDIIYSNTSVTCIGIITAILSQKTHIWHIHESTGFDDIFTDKKLSCIYNYLMNYKNNTTVFISNTQRKEWEEYLERPIRTSPIIYNPVKQTGRQCGRKQDGIVVYGYLGSFSKRKNIAMLVEVFYELHKTFPNTKLLMGGDGELRESIKETIKKHSLEDAALLLGQISDAELFYSSIDVCVLPSLRETWGLVTLEAMACCKSVIITIHTGLREIFEPDVDCIFIDPLDKTALYNAMERLLDAGCRETLAANGYNKLRRHDFNANFSKQFCGLFFA